MKKDQSKLSEKGAAKVPEKSKNKSNSPKTEFPLSEKDEVKQAEEKMRQRNKDKKK